ncbi:MAG: hypothetical protein IKC65_03310, partial [Lentisphaeria bacterium]|nr:hypothetical protein [Lentisphaeria bacterium]
YQNMLRKWHRIAAVRDAKTQRIYFYLDGRKIKEGDDTFAKLFNSPPGSLVIGEHFKGRIDEIIVWKGLKTDFAPAKVFKARIVPLKTDANVAASWKTLKEKKLDIVPAPKNLKITGKAFPFVPGQWRVVRLSKNDAAGAAEFEGKLARIGLAKPGSGKKIIKAGLYDEMKAELAKAKAPAKPMRQGYVLIADKEQILLAGSDREGLLYAWLTLADLIDEKGNMTPAVISDWPDFRLRRLETGVPTITGKNGFKVLDSFFRQRANIITLTGQEAMARSRKYPASLWRKINAYAHARGMRLRVTDKTWLYDLGKDYKKLIPKGYSTHYYPYKPEEGLFGYYSGVYSWSRDDLAKKAGQRLAKYLKETGFSGVGYHSIDCGNFDNPGNWGKRTEMDKKRWGNDRVGAEVNLIHIFYKELKAVNPDINVSFCQYPYWCVTDERMLKYYEDLAKRMNPDITFTLREGPRKIFLDNARRLAPHPVQTSIYPYDYSYLPSYTNSGRYAGSMFANHNGGTGFVHWAIGSSFNGSSDMCASEYMWNAFAPGAAELPDGKHAYEIVFASCPEMEKELLPRICRKVYGTKAGTAVARIYALKLCERIAEHPDNILPAHVKKIPFFEKMVADTVSSLKTLEALKSSVKGDAAVSYQEFMTYLKRTELLAKARLHCLRARECLNAGKVEEGKKEAAAGMKLLKQRAARNGKHRYWKSIENDLNITEVIETRLRRAAYLKNIKPAKVRVGLYGYRGSEGFRDNNAGILDGFNNVAGFTAEVVRIPTKANLKKVDVMVFNATKQIGDCEEDVVANIREFVKNGGGVIFAHNAVGRHEGLLRKPWFPDICKGFDATGTNQPTLQVKKPVATAGFLKAGDKYTHRYFDHCRVLAGPKGTVELLDNSGKVVLVSGSYGKGRVVYTGEIFGLSRSGRLMEPELEEWKMLFSLFRWCAGK